jgi:hypothetical protein
MIDSAIPIYKRIIELKPSDTQGYRNLALAYQEAKMFAEAFDIYMKYDKNQLTEAKEFGTLRKTMNNEFKNLVALHKNQINSSSINSFYNNNVFYDTRVVFEWNAYDAEFDLQIVNPQNRFFTWSHTQKAEPKRLANEVRQGNGLEEYFMTAGDKGNWIFNITYFGKQTGNNSQPTYLKITTYKNFGNFSQSKEIKVISLEELSKKETILKIKI